MSPAEALLDTLLPGDGEFPPAAATLLAARIAAHPRFGDALAAVLARLPGDVAALAPAARAAAVAAAEAADPAAFGRLVIAAYSLYYTHPLVARTIERLTGQAARPPQPLGHDLAPFDPAMVAVPAARPPLWRPTPEDDR